MNKKVIFLAGFFIFVVAAVGSYAYFKGGGEGLINPLALYKVPQSNGNGQNSSQSSEPKTEPCPINGQLMTKTQKAFWEKRRPLGIMVENSKQARPQSGISSADVVYEAVAEGGITRFLAIFYCQDAPYVGPVRSARVHFMKMLREYGNYPLYAHVGGANCDAETGSGCANGAPADALGLINKLGWSLYNDINQFSVPFPYFWRDYERLPNRDTEHTVYTSTSKLWDYAKNQRKLTEVDADGVRWDKDFTSWKFKDDALAAQRGTVNKISLGFWNSFSSDMAVTWNYNRQTNGYQRVNGGVVSVDRNNNQPVEARDVVIIFAKESPANDGYPGGHILYRLTGSGDGLLFQDGKAVTVTWEKQDEETRLKLYDENNQEMAFVRGKIFVEILPIGNKVEY
ncbi:MAG: DUF3048 domain-containing protein [Patescibacteria group bacterium]|nr:DUF3048 domain-containing protein [Patescibacteria group bacterium]